MVPARGRETSEITFGGTELRNRKSSNNNSKSNSHLIKVPGVRNFRDLGGYSAGNRHKVKKGSLYRSGHLADLTPWGLKILTGFDLYAIVDFRSNIEVERQPTRVIEGPQLFHLPVMDDVNREMSQEIMERIKKNQFDGFSPDSLMIKAYRQFSTEFTPAYKTFIHTLLEAQGKPVLWHCTAGKDRTGYAAAILFKLLDIDQETIYRDYLLSNQYVERLNKKIITAIIARGYKAYKMIKPLLGVQLDWLKASFDAIDEEWGSFESYISHGLALGNSEVRQLRGDLLQ